MVDDKDVYWKDTQQQTPSFTPTAYQILAHSRDQQRPACSTGYHLAVKLCPVLHPTLNIKYRSVYISSPVISLEFQLQLQARQLRMIVSASPQPTAHLYLEIAPISMWVISKVLHIVRFLFIITIIVIFLKG